MNNHILNPTQGAPIKPLMQSEPITPVIQNNQDTPPNNKPIDTAAAVGISTFFIVCLVIYLLFSCIAGYLSWQCNKFESTGIRIIYAILSYMFSGLYLIYYFIYRFLFGNKCNQYSSLN